jgi:Ca2+-transporting ATPase
VSLSKRNTADFDADEKAARRKQGSGPQEHAELGTDADPTPFRFRANDLAMMLDPKNLDTLEDIGGITGLLDGLGTTMGVGLGGESCAWSTTKLSSCGDGSPGGEVGVSLRYAPAKGEEIVPAITLTDPEGERTTNWNSAGALAASLDVRRHIYGENVLPRRATKSLLSLMYTALKDKVLVRQLLSFRF